MAGKKKEGGKKGRKIGRNQAKCAAYRARSERGNTVKARRVYKRLLKNKRSCPGWEISQMRDGAIKLP